MTIYVGKFAIVKRNKEISAELDSAVKGFYKSLDKFVEDGLAYCNNIKNLMNSIKSEDIRL